MYALFITVTKLKNLETFDEAVHMFDEASVAADL